MTGQERFLRGVSWVFGVVVAWRAGWGCCWPPFQVLGLAPVWPGC